MFLPSVSSRLPLETFCAYDPPMNFVSKPVVQVLPVVGLVSVVVVVAPAPPRLS